LKPPASFGIFLLVSSFFESTAKIKFSLKFTAEMLLLSQVTFKSVTHATKNWLLVDFGGTYN
jgi:hypothetical protein